MHLTLTLSEMNFFLPLQLAELEDKDIELLAKVIASEAGSVYDEATRKREGCPIRSSVRLVGTKNF